MDSSRVGSALHVAVVDHRLWPERPAGAAGALAASTVHAQDGPRRGRRFLIAALIGAGIGTGFDVALDRGCEGGDCPLGNYVIVISAGSGALLGALIGSGSGSGSGEEAQEAPRGGVR